MCSKLALHLLIDQVVFSRGIMACIISGIAVWRDPVQPRPPLLGPDRRVRCVFLNVVTAAGVSF